MFHLVGFFFIAHITREKLIHLTSFLSLLVIIVIMLTPFESLSELLEYPIVHMLSLKLSVRKIILFSSSPEQLSLFKLNFAQSILEKRK